MENSGRKIKLTGYFCSDTVFDLSKRVLRDVEITILEEDLEPIQNLFKIYAPIQNKINETGLQQDFEYFSREMRLK